ncbi:restriction endonuclease subunit S [Streptomyces sp. NRRL F-2747]|uniref:restriction endonuclease subunit S n=1 Tax=Streptomyces sp. NRRL F-2747 TaxID=1463843 RepID=UPI001F1D39D0|nr:restriction endonuclease subunit S [Streptomyces sp. NRRL F-2747]
MRLTRIGWLQGLSIPSDWTESKVKYVAPGMQAGEAITAESIDPTGTYPVYGGNGLRGYTEQKTHHGTCILIGRQGALCGNVHLVSGEYWASEHAIVARPGDTVDPRWLAHLLEVMNLGQYSQTAAQPGIGTAQINALSVPVPPAHEQSVIADYLDRETSRIDTLIEEQQRLIAMLRNRRFALRVSVALRGTVQTEEVESPLPWAKKLPAHWRIVPLTTVAELESGHTPNRSREDWWQDCYIPWVSLHDVGMMRDVKYLHDTAQHVSDAGIANSSARLLPARTVVLSRDATVGRTAIMGVPMATSQHFAAWVCGPDLDPEYLWVLFEDAMQPFFDSFQNGSTIRTIGMGDLKAFRIPLPPLDEQRRIIECLDEETAKIDTLIEEAARFIELSKERRSALITAAVTGQIDVREAA